MSYHMHDDLGLELPLLSARGRLDSGEAASPASGERNKAELPQAGDAKIVRPVCFDDA